MLSGGEDYELLFTTPRESEATIAAMNDRWRIQRLGEIVAGKELTITLEGIPVVTEGAGWDPFA